MLPARPLEAGTARVLAETLEAAAAEFSRREAVRDRDAAERELHQLGRRIHPRHSPPRPPAAGSSPHSPSASSTSRGASSTADQPRNRGYADMVLLRFGSTAGV
jgi:hypothetical protein